MKYLWLMMVLSCPLSAQIYDDFSDGDFNNDPVWFGLESSFEVDDENRLHLNAPRESGASYICTKSNLLDNPTWMMELKLEFNPSSSNYVDWYLMATDSVLKNSTKGYFIRVGGASDEVSLYRKLNGENTKIIDGLDKRIDTSPVHLRLKVTKSNTGDWSLWFDGLDGNDWILEGRTKDLEVRETKYTGVHCVYTATRSNRFYFDDFSIDGTPMIDRIPPKIITSSISKKNAIQLLFDSEDLSLPPLNHFELLPQSRPPITIYQDGASLELIFEDPLPINDSFQLRVSGLSDTLRNTSTDTLLNFYMQQHEQFDIVINEIMMKPEPEVQLPKVEYVELLNRANYPITLKGWQLKTNNNLRTIPEVTIDSNKYLLLTNPDNLSAFSNVITQSLTPWTNLSNTEGYLGLLDDNDEVIHEVHYHKSWLKNTNKELGGWALEMVDSEHYCAGKNNWGASNNQFGGTPGLPNSIAETKSASGSVHLESIETIELDEIRITWSESVYDSLILKIDSTLFYPPLPVQNIQHRQNKTFIEFKTDLEAGRKYFFQVKNLKDCYKNNIQESKLQFIKGVWPEKGALYLNELLFNPKVGGYDYVEIYNASENYIDLSKLYIGNYDSLLNDITNTERICIEPVNIPPHSYLALCENRPWIESYYESKASAFFLEVNELPNLPAQKGSVALCNLAYEIIDKHSYHEDDHFSRLETVKGVALERLNPYSKKWFSASSTENYGTPGRENSQFTYTSPSKTKFEIDPEVFTPNLDGLDDFTNITLVPSKPVKANIHIYNKKGLKVREVCQSKLITQKTVWIWNGLNQEKLDLPMGIYMVVVELWGSKGKPEYLKHPVVIQH